MILLWKRSKQKLHSYAITHYLVVDTVSDHNDDYDFFDCTTKKQEEEKDVDVFQDADGIMIWTRQPQKKKNESIKRLLDFAARHYTSLFWPQLCTYCNNNNIYFLLQEWRIYMCDNLLVASWLFSSFIIRIACLTFFTEHGLKIDAFVKIFFPVVNCQLTYFFIPKDKRWCVLSFTYVGIHSIIFNS